MVFTLVEATPFRLRYLCEAEDNDVFQDEGILENADAATADLRVDSEVWLGYPIANLVRTPVTNQTQARTLLLGDGLTSVASLETPRAHCRITPRDTTDSGVSPWTVDANEGAAAGFPTSAGFAVIRVQGPGEDGSHLAYLDIYYEHTFDR